MQSVPGSFTPALALKFNCLGVVNSAPMRPECLGSTSDSFPAKHWSISTRPADLAGTHVGPLSLFRISEKKNSRTIDARGGATVWSTVDHGPFVTPDHVAGNTASRAIHRKALAAQQQQFARCAARVSTD